MKYKTQMVAELLSEKYPKKWSICTFLRLILKILNLKMFTRTLSVVSVTVIRYAWEHVLNLTQPKILFTTTRQRVPLELLRFCKWKTCLRGYTTSENQDSNSVSTTLSEKWHTIRGIWGQLKNVAIRTHVWDFKYTNDFS